MSQHSVRSISPKELHTLCERGTAVDLIDVRPRPMFDDCRARPAAFVDFEALDPKVFMASRGGSMDEPLYIICQKGIRSVKTCELFIEAGLENVISVEGGTGAWAEAGLPIIRSEKGA